MEEQESQDLGDWDEEFLEAAIKAEEDHLSSQLPPSQQPPPPSATISSFLPQLPLLHPPPQRKSLYSVPVSREDPGSYSPPRELSQRKSIGHPSDSLICSSDVGTAKREPQSSSFRRAADAKDIEIERLKRELGRVSKQLKDLERESLELRKERDREKLAESGHSENEIQDANIFSKRRANSESRMPAMLSDKLLKEVQAAKISYDQKSTETRSAKSTCKEVGVQAEQCSQLDLSNKLLDAWGSSSYQNFGKNVIQKLMAACSTDFRYMSMNASSEVLETMTVKMSSSVALECNEYSSQASDDRKICHLYSVLEEISGGMMDVKALIEPLVNLCNVKNVSVVHRSLRILHALLKHLVDLELKSECTLLRNNIMVEELTSSTRSRQIHGSESHGPTFFCSERSTSAGHTPLRPKFDAEMNSKDHSVLSEVKPWCCINWVPLFELMHQIAMRNTQEHVRLEAVSTMNLIVMRSDAYMEREKFGSAMVFEGLSVLLRKDAGLRVQKEIVHLLYLLLNCPKILAAFSSCLKGKERFDPANGTKINALAFKTVTVILEGLADCMASNRNAAEDLALCRGIIILLAFLASSGTSGFEILVSHRLSRDANFLMLILQLLVSVIDTEAANFAESVEVFKARTLLMREALILLNRLVANPSSSTAVLRVLTKSRDMASLTIDIANRLSRKTRILHQSDTVIRQMRENGIIDLARGFKKRISAFLGDDAS